MVTRKMVCGRTNSKAFKVAKRLGSFSNMLETWYSAAPLLREMKLRPKPTNWRILSLGASLRPTTHRMVRPGPETEIHGEHASILTGKFVRIRKVFAREISVCPFLFEITWKVYRVFGKFPDCLKNFRIIWKDSRLSGKFTYYLESFHSVREFP